MKYKKILFATDFSPASGAAFECADALARESSAELLIVHVEEISPTMVGPEMLMLPSEYPNPAVRKMLEAVVPTSKNVTFKHHLLKGVAADEILRLAQEKKVDLIVIGTHGRTGLRRVLMGSVAELVVREAQCPVLSIKAVTDKRQQEQQSRPASSTTASAKSKIT